MSSLKKYCVDCIHYKFDKDAAGFSHYCTRIKHKSLVTGKMEVDYYLDCASERAGRNGPRSNHTYCGPLAKFYVQK